MPWILSFEFISRRSRLPRKNVFSQSLDRFAKKKSALSPRSFVFFSCCCSNESRIFSPSPRPTDDDEKSFYVCAYMKSFSFYGACAANNLQQKKKTLKQHFVFACFFRFSFYLLQQLDSFSPAFFFYWRNIIIIIFRISSLSHFALESSLASLFPTLS